MQILEYFWSVSVNFHQRLNTKKQTPIEMKKFDKKALLWCLKFDNYTTRAIKIVKIW